MVEEPCCQLGHGHRELASCVHQEFLQGGSVTSLMMRRVEVPLTGEAAAADALGSRKHWTEAGGEEQRDGLRELEQARR